MNFNPPVNKNQPDRATVERIAAEEAREATCSIDAVLGMSRQGRAVRARRMAFNRILRETGCSVDGLAEVWGCYAYSIRATISPPVAPRYDDRTAEALRWAHGDKRTASILAGRDPRTLNDLAAWRSLGSRQGEAA